MEINENKEVKTVTANQEILIKKLLKSKKFKDSEYREFQSLMDSRIVTSYDASVLINYMLGTLNFRRIFHSNKHKAYKQCVFCEGRDKIERYIDLTSGVKAWCCETCALNLDTSKIVRVKFNEEKEVKADLRQKYEYSPEQENSDDDLRHGIDQ